MLPAMLNRRRYRTQARRMALRAAPPRRPGAVAGLPGSPGTRSYTLHPLAKPQENMRLYEYEQNVKSAFDAIMPTLRRIACLQYQEGFESQAQILAQRHLGFELPASLLADAWVERLDMRRLYAWCVFETYRRFCDSFFHFRPLDFNDEKAFEAFLLKCGFHSLDLSPCADGRLAHVVRYVLRLPYRSVRRKSYAGAMFDIEDSLQKWVETEMRRYREQKPNSPDSTTRYLKAAVYHFSSKDPEREGCAAHGSDAGRAASSARDRLISFQQAVENSFCCGASIDLLLIGVDTDTDAIRIHMPGENGAPDLNRIIDVMTLFNETRQLTESEARTHIADRVCSVGGVPMNGMTRLILHLIENNISQIDYVRQHHGEHYADIGHAERFIGAGIGFEEIQLRNLTYFAYLRTVEEAGHDLDVGVKIFSKLTMNHGLPVPVVIRFDYHGKVPGARDRAVEHCYRIAHALGRRYSELVKQGFLHALMGVRDCSSGGQVEYLGCSVTKPSIFGGPASGGLQ